MKLAEALMERKEMISKIGRLNSRIEELSHIKDSMYKRMHVEMERNLIVVSKQLDECFDDYEKLLVRINLTNSRTLVDGVSLTKLMVRRENLKREVEFRKELRKSVSQNYCWDNEKFQMEESELLEQERKCTNDLRALNNRIQWTNWNTDLL